MEIALDEKQEILKKMARDFLERECPMSLVRQAALDEESYPKGLYRSMAELGWLGMGIPEEYGGMASDLVDLAVLYEEIGRALVPGPHFVSAVMCAQTILNCGSAEQKRELLPKIASGELVLTLAIYELDNGYTASAITLPASKTNQGYVLDGLKLFVPYAHIADKLICVARTKKSGPPEGGVTLFIVEAKAPGMSITPLKTMADDKQCEVVFQKVKVSTGNILGDLNNGWLPLKQAMHKANVIQCAEMVGGAQKALEMAVDYAKQRVQFGRPIGGFQAIQHKCADMATILDAARYLTYEAACKVRDGDISATEVAMAKALASTAYRRVTREAHQIFAGAGLMMEHDLNFYYRWAKAIELDLGDVNYQVEEVAHLLSL